MSIILADACPPRRESFLRVLIGTLRRLLPRLPPSENLGDLSPAILSDLGIEPLPTRESHRRYFDAEAQLGMYR